MITSEALNKQVSKQHTIAIIHNDTIIHTGMMADSRKAWDNIALNNKHGLFTYVGRLIDGSWNRITWMVK